MNSHVPVLLKQSIENLRVKENGTYIDCTLGSGGHSREIISRLSDSGKLISFDQDISSIKFCEDLLKKKNFFFVNDNFSNLKFHLEKMSIQKVDGFLFDLGLSSEQIDSERGFSYKKDDCFLDMRMNISSKLTAYEILKNFKEKKLSQIFFNFGEERFSRRIANSICRFRKKKEIFKVSDLVKIINFSIPKKFKTKKHPARKIFQALRIFVNNEIEVLEKSLKDAIEMISNEGTLVVISYHSLEDRIAKNVFKSFITKELKNVFHCSKKPITPDEKELQENNRSRSSKMRVLVRLR